MTRIEAVKVIVIGFEVMQRESWGKLDYEREYKERDEALTVLGVSADEIREAERLASDEP